MSDSLKIQLEKTKIQFDRTVKDMQLEQRKMQDIIDEQKGEILKLRQENNILKSSESLAKISFTEPEVIKKILSFYAKGYTYKTISEKMIFNKFNVEIEFIKEICQNIEDLDNEYVLYYKKEVEAYEEQLKIKPDLIKDQLAQILQSLINDASMDLDHMVDPVEKTKLRKEINEHAKELNKLLGNIVAEKENIDLKEEVNKVMENFNQNKIVSFKAPRRKVED